MPNRSARVGRILVVEDEGAVAIDIQRCLEESRFEVTGIATSMEEAIQEASSFRPDLILMDIRIKGKADGIEAAGCLHQQFGLPIIFLTAHDDADTLERAKRTDPMAFLLKPFKPAELISAVEIALKRGWAEQEIRARESSFLSAMDAIGDGVLTTDREGRIRFMNRAAEHLTGWQQDAGLGRHATEVVHIVGGQPDDPDPRSVFLNGDGNPSSDANREHSVQSRDGVCRWLTIKATRIAGADDNFVRVVVMQDGTQRKRTELEIRRLNEELTARVSELTAMTHELESFNYSISHDLRAPVRHIDGYTKILLERADISLTPEVRSYLDRVRGNAQRLGQMVDELLELSRTSRKEPVRVETALKTLVDEVILDLKPELQDREVEWRIGALPVVACDPTLTRQVFANLVANALKFNHYANRAVIEIGQTSPEGEPALFVRDNGVGFDMKYADKLFGVFQRLHRQDEFPGTGIGLATVQRIVHKHGGKIWAEAEPEKGATFYFTLAPGPSPTQSH